MEKSRRELRHLELQNMPIISDHINRAKTVSLF